LKTSEDDNSRRPYDASGRRAAAARTREAIVASAYRRFGDRGWSGTTIRDVAADAAVSPKTVEALFGTKAALLGAAVDFAIRGDAGETPILQRESARRVEHAADAAEMLQLHAAHLRLIVPRSARVVSVVEHAARADESVAQLWRRITRNRRSGVRWASDVYAAKRRARTDLSRVELEAVFWIVVNWATYRTLTELAGLDDDGYEAWVRRYYAATLLERPS
jgi:AcrR family transcriptional regulator